MGPQYKSEEVFDLFQDIDEGAFVLIEIFSCLIVIEHYKSAHEVITRSLTKRRIPMPANITVAGGNICHIDIRAKSLTDSKTLLGLFLVRFQDGFEYDFEIVRVSRWGSLAILRH